MDVREIERLADLVVAVASFVLGQELLDAQAGQVEQVAEGVFVFLCGQAAIERAAGPGDLRDIGAVEPGVEQREERSLLFGRCGSLDFGGISPAAIRSCTRSQSRKCSGSSIRTGSVSRSRPPFLVAESWHSRQ